MILSNNLQNAKQYFKIICIPIFVNFSKAVQRFCLFADEKLPKLENENYSDYKLEPSKWEILDLIQEIICSMCLPLIFHSLTSYISGKEPCGAQASFLSETEPTLWRTVPYLKLLQHGWEIMLESPKSFSVSKVIEKGLDKLGK